MNIIKKLIVLVLVVFVLSFSLTGFSEENAPKYIISDNLKMYNELLSKIGVVESDFLTADNNDIAITKEEFLVLMFKLLNFKFDGDEASLAEEVILSDKDNMGIFDDYTYGTGNQSKSSTEIKFEPVVWFVDVPVENPNFNAVSMALGMGMISSNNEKRFYPQKNISINEATKMLVSTLGYRVIAESKGGYPTGYNQIANSLSIHKGIDISKLILTKEDCIKLLYNALSADYAISTNVDSFEVVKGKTLLTERFKIKKASGIVNGNENTNFYDFSQTSENEIIIGTNKYFIGTTSPYNLLGYNVDYYYYNDDDDIKYNNLVYIAKNQKNDELIIQNDDFISYLDKKITYQINDESDIKNVEIPSEATILYNGRMVIDYSEVFSNLQMGEIRLVDNNNDNNYDVVCVSSYSTIVVDRIDSNKLNIYNKLGEINFINLDSNLNDKILIIDKTGNRLSFSNIKVNNVLFYSQSDDGYLKTVIVNNEPAKSGVVSEIYTDENKILINNIVFEVSKNFLIGDEIDEKFILGGSYSYLLDPKGKIAFATIEQKTTDKKNGYAYLLDAGIKEGVEGDLEVKLFTQFNEIVVVKTKGKLKINEDSYTNMNTALTFLKTPGNIIPGGEMVKGTRVVRQLLKYSLNANDELVNIDFPYYPSAQGNTLIKSNESNDSLHYTYKAPTDTTKIKAKPISTTLGGEVCYKANTIVFSVPASETLRDEEEQYFVYDTKFITNDVTYTVDAFATKEKDLLSDVIVIKSPDMRDDVERQSTTNSPMNIAVVKKITDIVNSKGETVKRIYLTGIEGVYNAMKFVDTYYDCAYPNMTYPLRGTDGSPILINNNNIKLEVGDVIGFLLNKSNQIMALRLQFKESTHTEQGTTVNASTDYASKNRIVYGSLVAADGNIFKLNITNETTDPTKFYSQMFSLAGTKAKVFVIRDNGTTIVKDGSITDIPVYNGTIDETSYGVLVYQSYSVPVFVVVYEL